MVTSGVISHFTKTYVHCLYTVWNMASKSRGQATKKRHA